MAGNPQELQYGERSQLQAAGQKELGISGGVRPQRDAGRPAEGIVPAQGTATAPTGIPSEHEEVMREYFEAERALRTARLYANSPTAGPWARLLYRSAQVEHTKAAMRMKQLTPDWEI